jgi:anaerobic selenocysteine-containing dehydrogenase
MLLSPPEHRFLNSTFVNIEALAQASGAPALHLHPDDASARGLGGGEMVRVWNDRGEFYATAAVTDDVRPGVAVCYGIRWNRDYPGDGTINDTTSQRLTDMGGGAVFYDNAVEVELAPASRMEPASTARAMAGTSSRAGID